MSNIDFLEVPKPNLENEIRQLAEQLHSASSDNSSALISNKYIESKNVLRLMKNLLLGALEMTRSYANLWYERAKRDIVHGNKIEPNSIQKSKEYYNYIDETR